MKLFASLLVCGTLALVTTRSVNAQSVTINTSVTTARITQGYYGQSPTLWIDVSGVITAPGGASLHHSVGIGYAHPTAKDPETQQPIDVGMALLTPAPMYAESNGTLTFSNAKARYNSPPFVQGAVCTIFATGSGQIPGQPGTAGYWTARGTFVTAVN